MPKALGTYRERAKYANELWRQLIYRKQDHCAVCGIRKACQAMHIFAKGPYPALRFELDNGAPGCVPCHRRIDSDHEAKRDWAIRYLGAERYEELRVRSQARSKMDLALTILYLERLSGKGAA